jgi:1,4-alpha-glucan branching enzyme
MKELNIWRDDPWLEPWKKDIRRLHEKSVIRRDEIAGYGKPLKDAVNNHLYYGSFIIPGEGVVFREWAPNALELYLLCDANSWQKSDKFAFRNVGNGNWELFLGEGVLDHGDLFKWLVCWRDGEGERIPAYARRVVQDRKTKLFAAQLWDPEKYRWKCDSWEVPSEPLIYEAHVGMSSEAPEVAGFNYFRENVIPRIKDLGYDTLQLMALQEHPYYGSFGYQVSGFFAVSSRFGTPEELKALVDEAHSQGIAVIMDIVHSHSVSNVLEGLSMLDGSEDLYFHKGDRGYHTAWGSRCFDYGRDEVLRFLLSNCKYWLEEYRLDGFRFDGVTSMIYTHHGLEMDFQGYESYFNEALDDDAMVYLSLANMLVKEVNPCAITIAEEVSGMPGLAAPFESGGTGFGFRMSMGVADLWIKWIKERRDEDWNVGELYYELTRKRSDEKTVSYAECHDQAMVGDKTIIFRLLDSEMYNSMHKSVSSVTMDRAIALHKMIRVATLATSGDGYLNFMGNEFGHPEWIDFPREGNGWSYHYARRQWSLAYDNELKYSWLLSFDKEMIWMAKRYGLLARKPELLFEHRERQILIFMRGNLLFAFNFSPIISYPSFELPAPAGKYSIVLDSDSPEFGGFGRNDPDVAHFTFERDGSSVLSLYLPSRSAMVLDIEPV